MRIGYQGEPGSNAEEAAKIIAKRIGLENYELVPLVSSSKVIGGLKRGEITYAVVALKNSIGGTVVETFDAIKNEYLELVATELLPIHHCLFKLNCTIPDASLQEVASHAQALSQTKETRKQSYPELIDLEIEDTAIGARWLSEGRLPETTAVICRRNAGERYGLCLIAENIEDDSSNLTEFRMFKLASIDYSNKEKPKFTDALLYGLSNQEGIGNVGKFSVIVAILISLWLVEALGLSSWSVATAAATIVSGLFLFLTSKSLKNRLQYRTIKGYWKYYSLPENRSDNEVDQRYEIPRVVEINEVDDELHFIGRICDKENIKLFEGTDVIVSPLDKSRGRLMYSYSTPKESDRGYVLSGIASVNWINEHPAARINRMSGWYYGRATKETGSVEYLRITKEEYDVHCKSDFLSEVKNSYTV